MERAGILVLLLLVAVFVAPSTSTQVLAIGLEVMTIAAVETEEGNEDYQYDREEAAGDIYSDSEYEDDAEQQGEQEPATQEVEEPDLDFDEDEPDF